MNIKYFMNKKNCMDGWDLLSAIEPATISAVVFDPQYRQIMDKMKFGNEGKSRQVARAELSQMSDGLITSFIYQIERVMVASAYMFLWADKFIVAEGHHNTWFDEYTKLDLVDMIVWKKGFGMGKRSRRTTEYLLVYQKLPKTTKNWKDKGIPDCFEEKIPNPRSKELHPHRKPLEFTKRLLRSVTEKGDIVLDPCAGSFSTFTACQEIGVDFIGCDINPKYCEV